jgi:PAS domain S-box-containing protein
MVFLLCILWWTGTALERYARRASQNERELQQLADAMPQVVWIANEEGKTGYYNRRVENFGGIKQVDGELYDWQAGIHPEDLESTIKLWNAAGRDTKVYEQEHRMLMADGTYRWHLSRAVPLIEEDGARPPMVRNRYRHSRPKICRGYASRKRAAFSRFMQHLPGLSWIKDAYGQVCLRK